MHRLLLVLAFAAGSAPALAAAYDPLRFEKEIIVPACTDPMQLEVTADGRVFFIERRGTVNVVEPQTRRVTLVGEVPVHMRTEVGLLGLALDRDFARSQALFLFFSPRETSDTMRLSRFILREGRLDLASEKVLLEFQVKPPHFQHMGGGLFMMPNGDLLLGTGDSSGHLPGLMVDERPGQETSDAQRTSPNSRSHLGKILRLHPTAEGGVTIPPGNLFPDGRDGLPEIFAMGVRNGFRVSADAKTGIIYWGDVGPNVDAALGVGGEGYDEIHQARAAGFFGHPYFTGPNEAFRRYDFATSKAGALYDVNAPRNDSPNSTGLRALPPPQPAFIWYPSVQSKEFPMLGSGGRAAMVGPVYRADPAVTSDEKLPEHFDHTLFIFDWMRNWIMAVHLDPDERIDRIRPILPGWRFRKPIELKLAPDHTLYLIESGDKWNGNTDSQISRLVYRRGNRAPHAVANADVSAGRLPLKVRFDARGSTDADGDALSFEWTFGLGGAFGSTRGAAPEFTFELSGVHPVLLTVSDAHGASSTTSLEIFAGNPPPRVVITGPLNGSFYESEQLIAYRASALDEDGGALPAERVNVTKKTTRRVREDESVQPPGLQLMRATTCFACHQLESKSVGPAFLDVAKKYHNDAHARDLLAQKILTGGIGVWGNEVPMPPHPQHTLEQTRQMMGWVLALADSAAPTAPLPVSGTLTAPNFPRNHSTAAPTLKLMASALGHEVAGVPALRGTMTLVLHPHRKKAATADETHAAEVVDIFEGGEGNSLRLRSGGAFRFDTMNLAGITHLTTRLAPLTPGAYWFEARLDAPDGPLLGREMVECQSADTVGKFATVTLPITASDGVHDVVFVSRIAEGTLSGKALPLPESGRILDVNWIEFHNGPLPAGARAKPGD